MGSVAAPFLGGLAATLAVLVISSKGAFRWPGATLFLLVGATLAFLASVQFSFWARQYHVTPDELRMWWPELPEDDEELRWEQHRHRRKHRIWAYRARSAYNLGLLCFLAALPVALAPTRSASEWRLAAIALAVLGLVLEMIWIGLVRFKRIDRDRA